jgi:putative ABC transport system permease protein
VTTIATGAAGLLLFMGFNAGLMNQYRDNTVRAHFGHGQVHVRGYWNRGHARPWDLWIGDVDGVVATLRALPGVREAFPRLSFGAMLVHGDASVAGQGLGIDMLAEARFFDRLNLIAGDEGGGRPDGLVIGRGLAEGLGVKVGDRVELYVHDTRGGVTIGGATVAGIFHTGQSEFDNRAFRLPLALAQRLVGTDRVETIQIALASFEAWPAFARGAGAALPSLEALPFDVLDEIYYKHGVEWLDAQYGFIRAVILLIVFLGTFNVIAMNVVERTVEIGILRANGDRVSDIAAGQILEAVALALMGGAAGILAGWAAATLFLRGGVPMPPAPGMTRSFRIVLELQRSHVLEILALCVSTAVTGCLIRLWGVIRMPIAQALRHA